MSSSIHKTVTSLAIALALMSIGAFADDTKQKPGEYLDDAAVTAKVKTALIESPEVKARQVDVETFRGVVQLNGFVESAAAMTAATRVAGAVKGVHEVHNNLVVADKSSTVSEAVDDSVLTAKVKTALIADPATEAHQINVETEAGVVQLSGFVDSASEKARATEVARNIAGVKDVYNVLEVKVSP